MTLTISNLAQTKSIADLKTEGAIKIRGGFFGFSVTKVRQTIIEYTQNAQADNGGTVAQAINGDVTFNYITQ